MKTNVLNTCRQKRCLFSYIFILLLFFAEICAFSGKSFSTGDSRPGKFHGSFENEYLSGICSPGSFSHVQKGASPVYIRNYGHAVHDDIEINKNIQSISIRVMSEKPEINHFKQSRRVNVKVVHPFGKMEFLLSLYFFQVFAVCFLGIAFTYSLKFIIQFIHFKNGEKINIFSL